MFVFVERIHKTAITGICFLFNGAEHCRRIVDWNGINAIGRVMYVEHAVETYEAICCFR